MYTYTCINIHTTGSTSQSATATIEVTVRDVNDITPALDRTEYSVSIRENTIPGDVIAIVCGL